MKWYKYDIRDLSETEYNKWFSLMNEEKQKKVNRFRFDDDKKRTVAGEMLARKVISEWCNISAEEITFGKNEHGKPFVENFSVEFNISHSGDFVVCVIDDKPIGIDIEQIRPVNLKIAKRIYTKDEILYLFGFNPSEEAFDTKPDDETLIRFFKLWTAKEAYLKCIGTGIVDNLNTLSVEHENIYTESFDNYIISVYAENADD